MTDVKITFSGGFGVFRLKHPPQNKNVTKIPESSLLQNLPMQGYPEHLLGTRVRLIDAGRQQVGDKDLPTYEVIPFNHR